MKVALYFRVSTKGQGEDDRYGLGRQRADVAAFVQRHGHEVVAEFEDVGYSGARADRPGLAALLEVEGAEAVVVPSWDRLARDTTLDGYLRFSLERRGLTVLSATQENGVDALSKLTQGILAAVAGYERHLITQRLAGSRKVKAARGGYAHGQPPYGTRAERGSGVLHCDPAELIVLRKMVGYHKKARFSTRAIAAHLNAEGIQTRNGKAWGPSSVHGALRTSDRVLALAAADLRLPDKLRHV
jgi:DNA invertase Pin-like site-specific DNA recombinase